MPDFFKTPLFVRIAFILMAAILLSLAAINFIWYASSTTDENVFEDTPSTHYIIKRFLATPLSDQRDEDQAPNASPIALDTIKIGDLLVTLNNKYFNSPQKIIKYLQSRPSDSKLEFVVFRSRESKFLAFETLPGAIPDSFIRQIPSNVNIVQMDPGGASDRAGLQVGDLIYSINGEHFKDAATADRIMQFAQDGNSIAYEVLRDDMELVLQVTLAEVGIRLPHLILFLCGLLFISTGLFFVLKRPGYRAARFMALAFVVIGFFTASTIPTRGFSREIVTLLSFITYAAGILGHCFLIHARAYFPVENPGFIKLRWPIRLMYAFAGITIIARYFQIIWLILLSNIFLVIAFVVALVLFRKTRSSEFKQMIRYLDWTVIGTFIVSSVIIGVLIYIAQTSRNNALFFNTGFIGIPLAFIPLAFIYTVGRYRLFDLDLRIRRNILYSFASVAWNLILASGFLYIFIQLSGWQFHLPNFRFLGAYIQIVEETMSPEKQQFQERIVVLLMGMGALLILSRLRLIGQRFIDKKFYREEYDYRRAASELSEVMSGQFSMVELAKGISLKLCDLMRVKQVGVMFLRGNSNKPCCSEYYGIHRNEWRTFTKNFDGQIAEIARKYPSDFRISGDYLPTKIREEIESVKFRHLVPIRSKDQLVGLLFIGEKRSESPFHKDDLAFLSSVAKQSSVAIENAFLYEELSQQDRLKHELQIARRIQLASLPQTTPEIIGLDIAGISIPALEVGGDYFDYLNGTTDEITVVVGDVSGKGTSAALYMSKVQGIMRSLYDFGLSPRELFVRANLLLIRDLEKQYFITAIGAAFNANENQLKIARAGHSPIYHYNAKVCEVEEWIPRGLGLGLTGNPLFSNELEELVISYSPGDVFLFVTDGITEAQDAGGDEFGEINLMNILGKNHLESAKRIRDSIVAAVNRFANDLPQHDDLTVVVVKVTEKANEIFGN